MPKPVPLSPSLGQWLQDLTPAQVWWVEDMLMVSIFLLAGLLVGKAWRDRTRHAHRPWVRSWYGIWCLLGLGALVIATLAVVGGYRVGGAHGRSMLPTLAEKNVLLVDTHAYGWRWPGQLAPASSRQPIPGDILLFHAWADDADRLLSKRVVAVSGDRVRYQEGVLWVNDRRVASPNLSAPVKYAGAMQVRTQQATAQGALYSIWAPLAGEDGLAFEGQVPVGHVFVVGDNWAESYDSRQFGPVALSAVRGRVVGSWSAEAGWKSL